MISIMSKSLCHMLIFISHILISLILPHKFLLATSHINTFYLPHSSTHQHHVIFHLINLHILTISQHGSCLPYHILTYFICHMSFLLIIHQHHITYHLIFISLFTHINTLCQHFSLPHFIYIQQKFIIYQACMPTHIKHTIHILYPFSLHLDSLFYSFLYIITV